MPLITSIAGTVGDFLTCYVTILPGLARCFKMFLTFSITSCMIRQECPMIMQDLSKIVWSYVSWYSSSAQHTRLPYKRYFCSWHVGLVLALVSFPACHVILTWARGKRSLLLVSRPYTAPPCCYIGEFTSDYLAFGTNFLKKLNVWPCLWYH